MLGMSSQRAGESVVAQRKINEEKDLLWYKHVAQDIMAEAFVFRLDSKLTHFCVKVRFHDYSGQLHGLNQYVVYKQMVWKCMSTIHIVCNKMEVHGIHNLKRN